MAENSKNPSSSSFFSFTNRIFVFTLAVLVIGSLLFFALGTRPSVYAATFGRTSTLLQAVDAEYFPELDLYIVVDSQAADVSAYDRNGAVVWAITTGFTLPDRVFNYNGAIIVLGSSTVYEIDEDGFISRSIALGWNESNADGDRRTNILYVARPSTDTVYRVNLDTFALGSTTSITANCDNPANWLRYVSDIDGFIVSCASAATPREALFNSTWGFIDSASTSIGNTVTYGAVDIENNEIWTNANNDFTPFTYNTTDITIRTAISTNDVYVFAIEGNYMYTADATRDNMLVYYLPTEQLIASYALNWDNEAFSIFDISIADDNLDQLFLAVSRASTSGYVYFTPFTSLLAGITLPTPGGGSVEVDSDGDGIPDFTLEDVDGDGIVDWDPSIVPVQLDDTAASLTNSLQMFGLNEDAAGLVGAMIIHLLFVGIMAFVTMKSRMQVPMFAWAFIFLLSGGISAALGLMDLLYFFAELVVIVAAFAFMLAKGVGQ